MTGKPTKDNIIDMHREVSILLLRSSNCFAVRTPKGQKDPGSVGWDPKSNSTERSQETIDVVSKTSDNLGIHLFGRMIDVDIDADNPYLMEALDYFLPDTPHIWGRKSRPRTHRLYELNDVTEFDPSHFRFLEKIQKRDDLKLEVRGGKQASGRYSILPGSLHPSGEAYEWQSATAARVTPVLVNQDRLMMGLRYALVAALLAPYWQEGLRNELCKALCGFLHRASKYSYELSSDVPFDKTDALRLLEGLMEVADDDPADLPMRRKTLEQTWEKAENGSPVLGATHITKMTGDEEILPLLYILLASTPDLQLMDALYDQYAVIRNTTNVVDLDMRMNRNYVMTKDAFIFTKAGETIDTEKGRIPVSSIFLNSLQRTIVEGLTIHPDKEKVFDEGGEKLANMWAGWGIEADTGDISDKDVEPFIKYIRDIVCNDDPQLFVWVRDWLADIFQNPTDKPGTALVLVGPQGAGKSMLCEDILRPIIGMAHSSKVSSVDRLTAKFNTLTSGKLLIQGEEVISTRRRHDANNLKDAITSKRRTVELKGKDEFEIDDFARYVFTSNHEDDAVNVEVGDRRYTIIAINPRYADKSRFYPKEEIKSYWRSLFGWLKDGNKPNEANLAKIHKWLLQQKIEKERLRSSFDTAIKRATLANSAKGMDSWLLHLLECDSPFETLREDERPYGHSFIRDEDVGNTPAYSLTELWPEYVRYSTVEKAYNRHVSKDIGEKRNAQQIVRYFKQHGLIDEDKFRRARLGTYERVKIRPFPTKARIVQYLCDNGYDVMEDEIHEAENDTPKKDPTYDNF